MNTAARSLWRVVIAPLFLLAVGGVGGCATFPPAKPVPDIATIAGKWSGNIDFGRGFQLFYLTINPDGSMVAEYGVATRFGKVMLNNAKATFELYIWSGTLDYLEGNGKRMIILRETFDTFYAQVTPLT
jgi:hypothetical protein